MYVCYVYIPRQTMVRNKLGGLIFTSYNGIHAVICNYDGPEPPYILDVTLYDKILLFSWMQVLSTH